MAWVRENITRDLEAGFTCWHADGTSGRDDEMEGGQLPVEQIAEATLELISFCESERKRLNAGPVSYEVGSEEQQGGLTAPSAFERYLGLLQAGLRQRWLGEARIDFVVAQTGTCMKLAYENAAGAFSLVQEGFAPRQVALLDNAAQKYRSRQLKLLFTQHYSDHVTPSDAAALWRFRAGKANFGPEMTMPELKLLLDWEEEERAVLFQSGRMEAASGFRETLLAHLDQRPDFWKKFIPDDLAETGEKAGPSIFDVPPEARDALLVFRGRYVKSLPACRQAARRLMENAAALGICPDPEAAVVQRIRSETVLPRLRQFRMTGLRNQVRQHGPCSGRA
jgi:hypothetical protein